MCDLSLIICAIHCSFRQLKNMSNMNRKSGSKMRESVHTNKLRCLDMEGKIAKYEQQLKYLESQVSQRVVGCLVFRANTPPIHTLL